MLKYFVFNLYLVLLAAQGLCEEPADTLLGDEYDDFNDTDTYHVPQPRFVQVRSNEKSYTLNFVPVNWHSARELCTAQNQVLASLKNIQENAGVVIALMKYGVYFSDATFWIGGSELGHIGQWSWVSTGQPISYSNWRRNPQSDSYCNKHCMEMTSNGQWNSNDCDLKRPVICEDLPACT